jgi:copper oxidase (laccase) domain-containing protein
VGLAPTAERASVIENRTRGLQRSSNHAARQVLAVDLPAYVAHRLRQSGIGAVETIPLCTYVQEADFFSYRRTTHRKDADYGRQLSAIMLAD